VTVEVQESTTAGDVKKKVLKRFKPGLIDPNLFTISVLVDSGDTHSCFVLRDDEELINLQHLWRSGQATYSLDAAAPVLVRIYTGKVFRHQEYKTVVVAHETTSLEALRILLQRKKNVSPEDYVLVREDVRDKVGEFAIKHAEPLTVHAQGPYAKIVLKKLNNRNVRWDEQRLISFIDYDSPDESVDDASSEHCSSNSSECSFSDYFTWMSDSVLV